MLWWVREKETRPLDVDLPFWSRETAERTLRLVSRCFVLKFPSSCVLLVLLQFGVSVVVVLLLAQLQLLTRRKVCHTRCVL